MSDLVSYAFPERQYKEITKEIKEILKSNNIQGLPVEWPHISIAVIDEKLPKEDIEEIKLKLKKKPTYRIKDLEIFEGARTPFSYLVLELDVPQEHMIAYRWLSSLYDVYKYKEVKPHVSLIKVDKKDSEKLKELKPQIEERVQKHLYPFEPSNVMIWSDFNVTDVGESIDIFTDEEDYGWGNLKSEAKYKGKEVELNKPSRGDVKKYKVYVKDPETGNTKKVNFGDPDMEIKRDDLERRKSFRARHKCDQAKDKTTPKYWSCRFWDKEKISDILGK